MRGFNYKKSVQSLNLLATKNGGTLNKMKAIKLIWLADRLHIRRAGRSITGDVYFALPRGPVASTTRDLLEQYDSLSDLEKTYSDEFIQPYTQYIYKSIQQVETKVFSSSDIDVLNLIWAEYGHMNQYQLEEYSHKFPEWKRYEKALESRFISRAEMEMDDFFINFADEKGLFVSNEESLSIIKDMYHEELIHANLC